MNNEENERPFTDKQFFSLNILSSLRTDAKKITHHAYEINMIIGSAVFYIQDTKSKAIQNAYDEIILASKELSGKVEKMEELLSVQKTKTIEPRKKKNYGTLGR